MNDRRHKDEFIPLKAAYLRPFFTDRYAYQKVRGQLIRQGVIECDGSYVEGSKSFSYKLGPRLGSVRPHRVLVTDPTLSRKIREIRENRREVQEGQSERGEGKEAWSWRDDPTRADTHERLGRVLERVEIDYPAALAHLTSPTSTKDYHPSDEIAIQMIRDRAFRGKPCAHGRYHSNLTNLRSDLRHFLSVQGSPLVNLDIRNSQPLILSFVLAEHFSVDKRLRISSGIVSKSRQDQDQGKDQGRDSTNQPHQPRAIPPFTMTSLSFSNVNKSTFGTIRSTLPSDAIEYIDLCERGHLYDRLMEDVSIPPEKRGAFKRQFFSCVLFNENRANDPCTPLARLFASRFPSVYAAIRDMKVKNYKALAHRLQRAESDLMIGRVARRCLDELPGAFVATIHDSIMTTPDSADSVRAIILQEFNRSGLSPTINTESLGYVQSAAIAG